LDPSGSEKGAVVGSCEDSNEPSGSVKEDFLIKSLLDSQDTLRCMELV